MQEKEAVKASPVFDRIKQPNPDRVVRMADVVIAGVLIGLTLPLLCLLALAIKWESPGPVLEKQPRIGRGGRRFQMLNFRTRVHDPQKATPACSRETTQLGHFFRYTRLDTLPQLINVLRGETTLIDSDP
jgi:lipopolysaccharide/colanic/teichoic acid biosynthesis glycosyltransferase